MTLQNYNINKGPKRFHFETIRDNINVLEAVMTLKVKVIANNKEWKYK